MPKWDEFSVAELQHLYGSLLVGEHTMFSKSPIIKSMIKECGESLDKAIKKFVENESN